MGNALLVPSGVVHKFNFSINDFGKEKIGVLFKIKSFRRNINIIDWEANHMQLEAWHLDEYFTDLQLLRVTRDFQRVIRAGIDMNLSKARAEKLTIRKDHVSMDVASKLNGLMATIDSISSSIKCKEVDNVSLSNRIFDAKKEVE